MKIGGVFITEIGNKTEQVRLVDVHPFGTIDIQVIRTGQYYRITGLKGKTS